MLFVIKMKFFSFVFSMARGVDNAAVVCCFMTSDYFVSYCFSMFCRFFWPADSLEQFSLTWS